MVDLPDRPLRGIRVVDAATLAAGPMAATFLAEFGAEVIKVEQPAIGDPLRTWGAQKDGIGLFWKSVSRNKQCVTIDLRAAEGQELFHDLLAVSDVVVVNNRPSALTQWGLDYESVHRRHPELVMLHVTGYGLGGPKSDRPGFGTLAEAMSGFAHVTGQADGPPTLPPFFLADGVAAQSAAAAVMVALYRRDLHGGGGQLVDVNLIEPLARLVEPSTLTYSHLGTVQERIGNLLPASAPRNAYRTSDGHWVALSSASPNIARRLFRAIDRPELEHDPDYADPISRQRNAVALDAIVSAWIESRTLSEVMDIFERAEVAAAPVYDAPQLLADAHQQSRGTFVTMNDPDLGTMTVQAPVAQLSESPGGIDYLGRTLGADNDAVFGGLLGLNAQRRAELRSSGTI
jgi:crotonobetainyl-CoA:carnitine CoA-transferase CaiB-like acyl-CoA transferase